MPTYKEHSDWWQRHLQYPDEWLEPVVVEHRTDPCILGDWLARGWGPQRGPAYPQDKCTPEQAERMQAGWDRVVEKARRDAARISEEFRLERYVATHLPDEMTLAAIITEMRKRYHGKRRTDDDDSHVRNDGDSGHSREGAAQPHDG